MNRQIGTQVTDRYEELPSKPTQNPVTDYAEFPSIVALFFFLAGGNIFAIIVFKIHITAATVRRII